MSTSHRCACAVVSRCAIYTHPSVDVQAALNVLIEAVTVFDQETGSRSVVAVRSKHGRGVFTSVTRRMGVE